MAEVIDLTEAEDSSAAASTRQGSDDDGIIEVRVRPRPPRARRPEQPDPTVEIELVSVNQVRPSPRQPRQIPRMWRDVPELGDPVASDLDNMWGPRRRWITPARSSTRRRNLRPTTRYTTVREFSRMATRLSPEMLAHWEDYVRQVEFEMPHASPERVSRVLGEIWWSLIEGRTHEPEPDEEDRDWIPPARSRGIHDAHGAYTPRTWQPGAAREPAVPPLEINIINRVLEDSIHETTRHRSPTVEQIKTKTPIPETTLAGFTRSLGDSKVVCARCDNELGAVNGKLPEEDAARSRKVYVRNCGHVYCGVCVEHIRTSTKVRDRQCAIVGCLASHRRGNKTRFQQVFN